MTCEQCKTDRFIKMDYSGGCYVCTECGLIANDHLISDEAYFDNSTESMSHTVRSQPIDDLFGLPTMKPKFTDNVTFFCTQDQHQLKLMKFNTIFTRVFQESCLNEVIGIEAKYMYLEFEKVHNFKGRKMELCVCAFIFIAAKKKNYAMNVKIFGKELETDIMKCVKFIEENTNNVVKKIEDPDTSRVFQDKDIEAFVRKYSRVADITRKMTQEVVNMIYKAEFIMRSKEIVAIALLVHYTKNNRLIKVLSREYCVSELAVKSALREIS